MATKTKHKVFKNADMVVPMLALLLMVIILLLVTPPICRCRAIAESTSPSVTVSLNPQSGPVGTIVTIHGSGFSSDNTIEMNGLVGGTMKDVASSDGKTLTFTVPSQLGPNCKPNEMCAQFLMLVMPNPYKISVITGAATQDIGTFTVTAN